MILLVRLSVELCEDTTWVCVSQFPTCFKVFLVAVTVFCTFLALYVGMHWYNIEPPFFTE